MDDAVMGTMLTQAHCDVVRSVCWMKTRIRERATTSRKRLKETWWVYLCWHTAFILRQTRD